jgi:hypothetical protein
MKAIGFPGLAHWLAEHGVSLALCSYRAPRCCNPDASSAQGYRVINTCAF